MQSKSNKIKKLKHAGTLVAVAGGLAVGGAFLSQSAEAPKEKIEYVTEFEKELANMSRTDLQNYIQEYEKTLKRLNFLIDSADIDPEKRFMALESRHLIMQRREIIQKKLSMER